MRHTLVNQGTSLTVCTRNTVPNCFRALAKEGGRGAPGATLARLAQTTPASPASARYRHTTRDNLEACGPVHSALALEQQRVDGRVCLASPPWSCTQPSSDKWQWPRRCRSWIVLRNPHVHTYEVYFSPKRRHMINSQSSDIEPTFQTFHLPPSLFSKLLSNTHNLDGLYRYHTPPLSILTIGSSSLNFSPPSTPPSRRSLLPSVSSSTALRTHTQKWLP